MKTKKKDYFGINVGTVSMVLIFVLLCLVSFAVLSIVSANADKSLSAKIADRTANYYTACNTAHTYLADTDRELSAAYEQSAGEEEYFSKVGHDKSFTIPISDTQTLLVEIEILYPQTADDTFYRIRNWKVFLE
ncbi:MAG: hypothetical protein ACI4HQ_07040 [Acetatifactor sp.]